MLGIEIQWIEGHTWTELLEMMKNKELDVLPSLSRTAKRMQYMGFSDPIFNLELGVIMKSQISDKIIDLSDMTVAYPVGYEGNDETLRLFSNVSIITVDSYLTGLDAIQDGHIDALLGDVTILRYLLNINERENLSVKSISKRLPAGDDTILRFGVRSDWGPLTLALNRALELIYFDEYVALANKYLGKEDLLSRGRLLVNEYLYTMDEMQILRHKKEVNLFVLDKLPPVSYFENGAPKGIVKGYMNELTGKLGITFKISGNELGLDNGLELIEQEKIDLILTLTRTPERLRKGISFSDSYLYLPLGIYGHKNSRFNENNLSFENYKIFAIKDHSIIEWFSNNYPRIPVNSVPDVETGLKIINKNSDSIYLGDTITTNHSLSANHFNNILYRGSIPYAYELSAAAPKEQSLLLSLINKTIKTIQNDEKQSIESFWIGQKVKRGTDPQLIFFISGTMFILLLSFFLILNYLRMKNILMKKNANTDKVTGLYNRHFFEEVYEKEFSRCIRDNKFYVFMIFDIDNFKKYNDSYGHHQGDEALKQVAACLSSSLNRGEDFAFRLGGEEFGVLTSVSNKSNAVILAEKIRKHILSQKIDHKKNRPAGILTISGGVVVSDPTEIVPFEDLYNIADKRLYNAKKAGRNQVFSKN